MKQRHTRPTVRRVNPTRICAAISVAVATIALLTTAPHSEATPGSAQRCDLPAAHGPETTSPADEGFDRAGLDAAIEFATARLRTNIQIYRNNCLIGTGPHNDTSGDQPWNLWSSTKAVVAMLAGIAYTQDKLSLDAPIGTYLPPGQGDGDHRAITVRQLLTQTSGTQQASLSEAVTAGIGLDPNLPEQALAMPIRHQPGTYFEYTQHGPDLLAYVIERSVGDDLQHFAQTNLFDPLGIDARDYYWQRDRSNHTYGFAFLFMPPNDYARLGLLMLNHGNWNSHRIIATDYIDQLRSPSAANPCYGFLFWVNRSPCTGGSFPSRQTIQNPPLEGLPDDAYAMIGMMQQNNFIVPSLGLLITWTGTGGDLSPDPSTVLSSNTNSELYHSFFRLLGQASLQHELPDAGPYVPSMNLDVDPSGFFDPGIILGAFGIGPYAPPDCDLSHCGPTPLEPPQHNNPGCSGVTCTGPLAP